MQLIAAWAEGVCACGRSSSLIGQPAAQSTALGLAKCLPVLYASRPAAHQPTCIGTRVVRAAPPLLAPLPIEEAWLHPPALDSPSGQRAPQRAGDSIKAALLAAALDAPLLPAEQQEVRLMRAWSARVRGWRCSTEPLGAEERRVNPARPEAGGTAEELSLHA